MEPGGKRKLPAPKLATLVAAVVLMGATSWAQTTTTTISGTVYDPRTTASALPLPGVLVYATTSAVAPLPAGVQCLTYQAPSNAASYAKTAVDGTFTLQNVPVNTSYTVVIQSGNWRRQFPVPVATTPVTGLNLHMPSDHTQGDIPLIAIATGSADGVECVLRDMGIADTEFTDDTGSVNPGGRIHLYQGSGAAGEFITPSTPQDTALTENTATLNGYDMVMFPCQGAAFAQNSSALNNIVNFANAGGRVFTTHYSFVWLDTDPPFNSPFPPVANWHPDEDYPTPDPGIATVNTGFDDGATLAQWLKNAGATYQGSPDQIVISTLRHDMERVIPPTQAWLNLNDTTDSNPVMQMTFNAPVGAAANAQCGRVLFNEYHVIDQEVAPAPFPTLCPANKPMSAQEEMLEYALFDLSTFEQPVITPSLTIAFNPSPLIVKQNDTGDSVTVIVTNTSSNTQIDSSAGLTVTLPPDVTATAIADANEGASAGGGWNCALATLTCTRTTSIGSNSSDAVSLTLAVGAYPPGGLPSPTGLITAVVSSPTFSSNVTATDEVIFQQQPTITWATPAPIVYGTPLSALQLDASSTLAGAFTYTPGAGTVLTTGQHPLTAMFAPSDSTDYTPGTASVTQTVVAATPQVQVTATANPVFVSNAVTFTANLVSAATTPTGTVTFYDGITAIGTVTSSAGMATLTTSALALGSHAITATYSGDSNYQTATSANLAENVEDFSLTVAGGAGADSETVFPGSAANFPLSIAPLGGATLAGAVSMTIAGLPDGTTASLTPDTVAANSGTTNLTLLVMPASIAELPRREQRGSSTAALGLGLGLVLLPFAARLRRTGRRWLLLAVIASTVAISIGVSACGGITYTPRSYTLTIKGQAGDLSHSTTVKVTIE
jgi:hypothetical protein